MPYKPSARQYRSFAASNFKPITRDDQSESSEPSYKVRGYYTTWNTEYELYPRTKFWPAEYEQIDRHALDNADLSDVIFQENHEGSPLARLRNNSLILGTDEHGAWCEAYLGGCQRGRDLYESICNGLVVEMSFGFTIDSNDESEGFTSFKDEEGDYHSTITRISKIYDCSAVSIPANPTTEISEIRKRSYLADVIESDRQAEFTSDKGAVSDANEPEERSLADTLAAIPSVIPATEEEILNVAERMEQSEQTIDDETLRRYAEAIIAEMDRRNAQVELEIKGAVEELDVEPAPVGEFSTEERVAEPDRRRARMRRARALALKTI